MFGRSWARFLSGTEIFFFVPCSYHVDNFTFHIYYRAQNSPSLFVYQLRSSLISSIFIFKEEEVVWSPSRVAECSSLNRSEFALVLITAGVYL